MDGIKFIARKIPVTICSKSVIPNRNPKFHRFEIDRGVGSSIIEEHSCFNKGSFK